jgi:hypothetical protein
MPEWRDRWIEIGLRTGPADRERFERCVARCYEAAKLAPPKRVVWTTSPMALALAGPASALAIEWVRRSRNDPKFRDALLRWANGQHDSVLASVRESVHDSVLDSVDASVRDSVRHSVDAGVRDSVDASVGASVRDSVRHSVLASVRDSVLDSVDASVLASVGASVRDSVLASVLASVLDSVDASVRDSVDAGVLASVLDSVDASVRDSVLASVLASVDAGVRDSVLDSVDASVLASVGASVRDSVLASVGASVRDSVLASVLASVNASVRDSVLDSVDASVLASVDASVLASVGASVWDQAIRSAIRDGWLRYLGGQFWVGGWWGSPSYVSFFREVCGLDLGDEMGARAEAYAGTCESTCWWWPHRDFVIACERPSRIDRDAQGRLHSLSRHAIEWPDGWCLYRIHGVAVPREVVEHPERITVASIDAESNDEVRRIMVDRFGSERFLRDSGAERIQQDRYGTLYQRTFASGQPAVFVHLVNSTPEADGSRREFWRRVHPELRPLLGDGQLGEPQALTAHNAVASTYGLRGEEYAPAVET